MKSLSLILITFICLQSFGQTLLSYDSVLIFDGKPKDKLYSLSKQFLIQAFKDSKEVIQLDDKEGGIIIAKGNFSYQQSNAKFPCGRLSGKGIVEFTLKIQIKDGKIKVTLSDFKHITEPILLDGNTYPNLNVGVIYKDKSYTSADEDGPNDKCREKIYKDILAQSLAIYTGLLTQIGVEFSKDIKGSDW